MAYNEPDKKIYLYQIQIECHRKYSLMINIKSQSKTMFSKNGNEEEASMETNFDYLLEKEKFELPLAIKFLLQINYKSF